MIDITSHPNEYSEDGIYANFADELELDHFYNLALLGRASERMLSNTNELPKTQVWIGDGDKDVQYPAFIYPLPFPLKGDMAILYVNAKERGTHYFFAASLNDGEWDVPATAKVVRVVGEESMQAFGRLPLSVIAEYLGI